MRVYNIQYSNVLFLPDALKSLFQAGLIEGEMNDNNPMIMYVCSYIVFC